MIDTGTLFCWADAALGFIVAMTVIGVSTYIIKRNNKQKKLTEYMCD